MFKKKIRINFINLDYALLSNFKFVVIL